MDSFNWSGTCSGWKLALLTSIDVGGGDEDGVTMTMTSMMTVALMLMMMLAKARMMTTMMVTLKMMMAMILKPTMLMATISMATIFMAPMLVTTMVMATSNSRSSSVYSHDGYLDTCTTSPPCELVEQWVAHIPLTALGGPTGML